MTRRAHSIRDDRLTPILDSIGWCWKTDGDRSHALVRAGVPEPEWVASIRQRDPLDLWRWEVYVDRALTDWNLTGEAVESTESAVQLAEVFAVATTLALLHRFFVEVLGWRLSADGRATVLSYEGADWLGYGYGVGNHRVFEVRPVIGGWRLNSPGVEGRGFVGNYDSRGDVLIDAVGIAFGVAAKLGLVSDAGVVVDSPDSEPGVAVDQEQLERARRALEEF